MPPLSHSSDKTLPLFRILAKKKRIYSAVCMNLTGLVVVNEWPNQNGRHPLLSMTFTCFNPWSSSCLSFCAIFFLQTAVQYVSVFTGESLFCLASCDSVFSCCCLLFHILLNAFCLLCLTFVSSVSSPRILSSLCATDPSRGQFWVCRNCYGIKNTRAALFLF